MQTTKVYSLIPICNCHTLTNTVRGGEEDGVHGVIDPYVKNSNLTTNFIKKYPRGELVFY